MQFLPNSDKSQRRLEHGLMKITATNFTFSCHGLIIRAIYFALPVPRPIFYRKVRNNAYCISLCPSLSRQLSQSAKAGACKRFSRRANFTVLEDPAGQSKFFDAHRRKTLHVGQTDRLFFRNHVPTVTFSSISITKQT